MWINAKNFKRECWQPNDKQPREAFAEADQTLDGQIVQSSFDNMVTMPLAK